MQRETEQVSGDLTCCELMGAETYKKVLNQIMLVINHEDNLQDESTVLACRDVVKLGVHKLGVRP